ncbi:MAG TPA: sigma-54 dependent transcriptional regulator [Rectinemataceae bacterium]|nr:sigma-54 dependent transcriptional regulator [Rectinemataceae bacterium]
MKVLIVDDERGMSSSLVDFLALDDIEAVPAASAAEAMSLLGETPFDAIVSDLRMPKTSGLELLAQLRELGIGIPFIMMSAHGEVRDAVEAMKGGAWDYLVKPFDPEELVIRLRKAVAERRALDRLAAGIRGSAGNTGLVGESAAMVAVRRLIAKAAPSPATILLTGESGTGKEVAARSIHELSGREGPFVAVNIGALPESLLESELFGHEKGAFTGADSRRIGLFEAAQRGTLFLDEIGELPLHLQVKLLRAIQERKIQRLGSSSSLPIDVRLLAATNRDLETEVREGRFREDLYYRIDVVRIRLPPLREREGDRSLLAGHFFASLTGQLGRKLEGISPSALSLIEEHPFPGNVRELANVMERAIILAEGPWLEPVDFRLGPVSGANRGQGSGLGPVLGGPKSLEEVEKEAIEVALARNRWHRERSAAELGITRRTLLNKMKEYGIEAPQVD